MDTETPQMSYEDVLNLYKRASSHPAVRGLNLQGFAQKMNQLSGTQNYNQGLHDNWLKRASVGFDELLNQTGVPGASADLFGGIGSMVGPQFEEAGRGLGQGLPRAILEGIPIGLATTVAAPIGVPLAAAATLSSFAKGYADSGSPAQGIIHAGVNMLFPTASRLGAKYITGGISKRLGTIAGDAAGDSHVLEKMVDFAGEALGGTALAEAGGMASRVISGQPVLPTTKDLFADMVPNLVFAPFNIFHAIKGPKAGEFGSVGHMLRAEELTKMELEANAKKEVTKVASTEEAKVPTPSENDIATADLWSQHVKLRENPSTLEYASQLTTVKEPSLFGESIRPQEQALPGGGVRMFKRGTLSERPDAKAARFRHQINDLVEGGQPARKLLPEKAGAEGVPIPGVEEPKPVLAGSELLSKAAAVIEQGVVGTGAEGLHEAATTANDLAKARGAEPVVTDATLSAKTAAHTDAGLPPEETLRKLAQSTENKVNEEAAKLSTAGATKKRNLQSADEKLAALPEPVKNFLGEAITKVDQGTSKDALSDVASKNYTQAALGWLRKAKLNPEEVAKWTPEQRAEKMKPLLASLNKTNKLSTMGAAAEESAKGVVRGEDAVNLPSPPAPIGLDPFAKEAVEGAEQSFVERATPALSSLIEGGDISPAELAVAGLKKDEILGRRISAILRDIALGAEFGSEGNTGKKGFKFTPSEETKKVFGTKNNATIQKFLTENMKAIRTIVEGRLAQKGVDLSISGPLSVHGVKLMYTYEEGKGGKAGSFAPAVREFFNRYYMSQGHTVEDAARFSEVAMKVASVYKDIQTTQIAELVNKTAYAVEGLALSGKEPGSLLSAIGLNLNILPNATKEFRGFFMNYVLGHEVFHRIWRVEESSTMDPVRLEKLRALREGVVNMDEADREAILRSSVAHMVPIHYMMGTERGSATDSLNHVIKYGASDPDEFLATYMGLLAVGAASPRAKEFAQDVMFSPKFLSDFANQFYTDLRDVTSSVIELAKTVGAKNTDVAKAIGDMNDSFTMLARTREGIAESVAELARLESTHPRHFAEMVDSADIGKMEITKPSFISALFPDKEVKKMAFDYLERAGAVKSLEPYIGKKPNWFERNIMIPAHLRELYPVLKDVTNLIFGYRGQVNRMITQGMTPFMTVDKFGKPTFDSSAPLIKVRSNPKMELAASEIMLEQNWNKKAYTHEDAMGLTHYPTLSPEQQGTVMTLLSQHKEAMAGMRQAITEYHKMGIADALANIAMREGGLRAKDAIDFGMTLVPLLMDATDPVKAEQVKPTVQAVLTKIPPEIQPKLMTEFAGLYQKFTNAQETLNAQAEYYSPETRLGSYYVRYTKDGVRHFVGKADATEAAQYVAGLKANKAVDEGSIQVASKYDRQRDVNTLYSDIINVFSDLEKTAYENSVKGVEDPETQELFRKLYTPGEAVFREVTARGFGKHFLPRKLVPGREEINMVQGVVAYIEGMSTGMAKSVTKRRAGLLLADPEMKQNPALRNLSRDYTLTVVDPPAREWSKVKSMAFHYFLGGNLSSLLVERMQPLFTLAPELTRQGAGLAGGYKLTGEAMKALFGISTKGDSGLPKEWDVAGVLKRAQDEQRLDSGVFQEIQGLDTDSTIVNLRRASFNAEGMTPGQLLAKPLYMYGQFMRGLYMHATSYNAKTAFMAGYIFKKKQGMSNSDAYDFAVRTTESTMFGGGAASKPIGLFANKGNLTGAVGALYTLRHYGFSMISDYYRLAKDSFSKSDLTDVEKGNAKKALGQMVATQLLMSGTLGLPMAGAALSIMEQIFPNLELKAHIREGLASLGGDDQEMGELVSDMALKGVLSSMLPVDVSARFGLGDLFGLDANRGFSYAQVFGAPGSILERWVKGTQDLTTGDTAEAVKQFLPNSVGNIVKLFNDDAKIRDAHGNLIYEPSQAQTVLAAIGFRPKEVAKYRDQQAMMTRADEVSKREQRAFHDNMADFLMRGQADFVRQALMQRQLVDENYDAKSGLRAVVESAQRKMFPAVPSTGGSREAIPSKEAIGATYPSAQQGQPSATALLEHRKQMEQSVAIPGSGQIHPREMQKAQIVDYLQKLNPTMSRLHAQALAERMLGGIGANKGRPPLSLGM